MKYIKTKVGGHNSLSSSSEHVNSLTDIWLLKRRWVGFCLNLQVPSEEPLQTLIYSPNTILKVQLMPFIMHAIFWHANQVWRPEASEVTTLLLDVVSFLGCCEADFPVLDCCPGNLEESSWRLWMFCKGIPTGTVNSNTGEEKHDLI